MPESNKPATRYPIPAASADEPHITNLAIRKSRFMAQTCQCASDAAARSFIARIKALHPDATHNCWAYMAGPPGNTAHMGSSDDGEPRGTAGRPMLNALLHCGTGQICVVVSRWFGGIKLGASGLVHAYQDSVLDNLATLPLTTAIARHLLTARFGYEYLPRVRQALPQFEAAIQAENYGVQVELALVMPQDKLTTLRFALTDITRGGCEFGQEEPA